MGEAAVTNNNQRCIHWCKERSIGAAALGTTAIAVAILGGTIAVLAATGQLGSVVQFAANGWQLPAVKIVLLAGAVVISAAVITATVVITHKFGKESSPQSLNGKKSFPLPTEEEINEQRTDTSWIHKMTIGDVAKMEELLAGGAKINQRDKNDVTPLHWAAFHNDCVLVKELLKKGADTNAIDDEKRTPLHFAVGDGAVDAIEILVEENPNLLEKQAKFGYTAMHHAALFGHSGVLRILKRMGANIDAISNKEKTPLHVVANKGNLEVVNTLIELGANKDILNIDNKTAADLAQESIFIEDALTRMKILQALGEHPEPSSPLVEQ